MGRNMSALRFFQDQRGATAIEYGLVASMFAVICILAAGGMSDAVTTMYNKIRDEVIAALS